MNENDKWYWETLNMGNPPTGTTDTKITGNEILNAINNVANVAGNPLTGKDVLEFLQNPSTAQVSQNMLNAAEKAQKENIALQNVDTNNLPGGMFENYYKNAQNQAPNDKIVIEQVQTPNDKTVAEQVNQDFYDTVRQAAQGINDKNIGAIAQIAGAKNLYNSAKDDVGRKIANDNANFRRQLEQMRGVDLGLWGDGGNLSTEQSNLALALYGLNKQEEAQKKFKTLQDDLQNKYGYSSQQYFDERYDYYRSKGIGHNRATILAGRETLPYQKERTGFLQNAIDEYGIDDGTTLNQFGVSVLGKLADEDNITGTAYANAYAKPLNEYNYRQDIRKMADLQKNNIQNAYIRAGLGNWLNTQNWNLSEISKDRDVDRANEEYGYKAITDQANELEKMERQFNLNLQSAKALATFQNSLALDNDNEKMRQDIEGIKRAYNYTDDEAVQHYWRQKYPLNGSKIDEEFLKDQRKLGNYLTGQYAAIENYLDKDDMQGALSAIEGLRTSLSEKDDKYNELLNMNLPYEVRKTLNQRLNIYEKVAKKEITIEEMQKMLGQKNTQTDSSKENNNSSTPVENNRSTESNQPKKNEQPKMPVNNIHIDPNTGQYRGDSSVPQQYEQKEIYYFSPAGQRIYIPQR